MPAWLEGRAAQQARDALTDCDSASSEACTPVDAIDIDAGGIWISQVGRRVAGHRVVAHDIRVAPRWDQLDGLDVEVGRLQIERAPVTASAKTAGPTEQPASPPTARPVPDTRGATVHVHVRAPIEIPARRGFTATVTDAELVIDAHGSMATAGRAALTHARLRQPVTTTVGVTVRGDFDHWQARGDASADDALLQWSATPTSDGLTWTAVTGQGSVVAALDRQARGLQLTFDAFDLGATTSFVDLPTPDGVHLQDAALSGTVETTGALDHVHLSGLTITGAFVDHRKVSREPLSLDGVTIDGDVARAPGGGFAQLSLARGNASAQLSLSASAQRYAFDLRLPPTDCQTVVDAMPHAMRDALDGLRLEGELAGHATLVVDRAALQAARDSYRGRPGDVPPRAGTLDLDIPFEDSCTVEADPGGVDLAGLLGPYRHRFDAGKGAGARRIRVMAPGADGYLPLSRIEMLGAAFRTLEDGRFFDHDGFDREQIANALWHNLIRGAVQRGASTISQQTTRNLWLGVDRSAARKLQEALLTTRLEAEVPKHRILELYLNLIELGPGLYGVEAAAQHYFGKSAADLSVRETVHIAALAPAPSRFAERFADGEVDDEWEAWLDRQIHRMYLGRHITWAQRAQAMRQRTVLVLGSDAGE